MTGGYQGRFGKDSALEFFQRDDWYNQMFIVHGGNYSSISWLWFDALPLNPSCVLIHLYLSRIADENKVSHGEKITPPMAVGRGYTVQPRSECLWSGAGDETDGRTGRGAKHRIAL